MKIPSFCALPGPARVRALLFFCSRSSFVLMQETITVLQTIRLYEECIAYAVNFGAVLSYVVPCRLSEADYASDGASRAGSERMLGGG